MWRQLQLFENKEDGKGDNASEFVRRLPKAKSKCSDNVRPFLRYPGSKYNASKFKVLGYGSIETPAHTPTEARLVQIAEGIKELVERYRQYERRN